MINERNKKYESWAENLEWLDLLIYLKANNIIWGRHNFVELYQKQKIKDYIKKVDEQTLITEVIKEGVVD